MASSLLPLLPSARLVQLRPCCAASAVGSAERGVVVPSSLAVVPERVHQPAEPVVALRAVAALLLPADAAAAPPAATRLRCPRSPPLSTSSVACWPAAAAMTSGPRPWRPTTCGGRRCPRPPPSTRRQSSGRRATALQSARATAWRAPALWSPCPAAARAAAPVRRPCCWWREARAATVYTTTTSGSSTRRRPRARWPGRRIRQQSSLRDNSFGAQPVQLVQPSARAFTDWSTFVIDAELLLTLNQSALATPNLAAYLYANPGDISGPLLTYAMLGGRSNPSNPFSTTWTSSATANSSLTSASSLNADYADFWLWLQQANVWIRVGNVTCLQTSFSCADWVFPEQLLQQVGGGVDLLTSLSNISELAVAAVQPDQLIDTTGDMGSIASYIAAACSPPSPSSAPPLTRPTPPTTRRPPPALCAARTCRRFLHPPSPRPWPAPSQAEAGRAAAAWSAPFYNNVGQQTTLLGIGLSQYRPNASEGSASGSYVILTATAAVCASSSAASAARDSGRASTRCPSPAGRPAASPTRSSCRTRPRPRWPGGRSRRPPRPRCRRSCCCGRHLAPTRPWPWTA